MEGQLQRVEQNRDFKQRVVVLRRAQDHQSNLRESNATFARLQKNHSFVQSYQLVLDLSAHKICCVLSSLGPNFGYSA